MTIESYLSQQLQKFSTLDLMLVSAVYWIFALLIFSLFPHLSLLDWWFYLIFTLLCALPLLIHLFSQSGQFIEKLHLCVKSNNPSNQVLLFLTIFFFALMLGTLLPILASAHWWAYLIIMMILAIKPLTVTWFW